MSCDVDLRTDKHHVRRDLATKLAGDLPGTAETPKLEFLLCLTVWCAAVFYALYRAARSASDLAHLLSEEDFEPGWKIFGGSSTRKDISDYEWNFYTSFVLKWAPWVSVHVFASNYLKRSLPQLLPWFYVLFSLVYVTTEMGVTFSVFLLCQIGFMLCVSLSGRKWFCWLASLSFHVAVNLTSPALIELLVERDSSEEYVLSVVCTWTTCRCLSFCMLTDSRHCNVKKKNLLLLAYTLYFPLLFTGPLIMYDDFVADLMRPPVDWTFGRLIATSKSLLRFTFWFVVNEVVLHFFYVSALHYQPHLVARLSSWSLCGVAFGMAQFFMTKYVVMYGVASTAAESEGFRTPPVPKCICRIHVYSDMWKFFDFGLYTFLKRNIYIPACSGGGRRNLLSKVVGSAACFFFVFLFHGATSDIFVWVGFNFVGIIIENVAATLVCTTFYKDFLIKFHFGQTLQRHLKAFVAAPLLIMSAVSNFYFVCGGDVGSIVLDRVVLRGWPSPVLQIWIVFFCMCHVSETIRSWELCKRKESGPKLKKKITSCLS